MATTTLRKGGGGGGPGGGGGGGEKESDIFQSVSRFLSGILDVKCS